MWLDAEKSPYHPGPDVISVIVNPETSQRNPNTLVSNKRFIEILFALDVKCLLGGFGFVVSKIWLFIIFSNYFPCQEYVGVYFHCYHWHQMFRKMLFVFITEHYNSFKTCFTSDWLSELFEMKFI